MEILDKIGLAYLWSAIKLQMSNYQSLAPGVAIPSGADLDDYVEPGTYYVSSAAVAASLTNSPTTGAGYMLTVVKTYGSASTALWRTQIAMTAAGISYLRYRNGSAGTWSSWQKLVFTDTTYAEVTAGAAGLMSPADKAKLDGFETASTYALQSSIDAIEVGGRNLLLKSASRKITAYAGAALTFETGVSVDKWNAVDAIRVYGTAGTSTTWGTMNGVSGASLLGVNGQNYVHSIYIQNNGDTPVRVTNNTAIASTVQPGESKRVVLCVQSDGTRYVQFVFSVLATGESFDITYWHPQIEYGTVATDWTPAPEDKADAPVFVSAVLSVAGWTDNADEATKERYPKVYALAVSGATAAHGAECCIAPASMEEAVIRGVCPSASVTDGYVNFYAQEEPTAAIAVQYRLI